VAADAVGNFVVAWASYPQGRIVAQRFGGLQPAALAVDAGGNSVLDPGETASVAPAWRNVNGAVQTFGGGASAFTGPAGPTYEMQDATGAYGTVADGVTQACVDCYQVRIQAAARPVLHWDASLLETITPDAMGQAKRWRLHVGGSFTDVAADSPFYRFVEGLLHHGVTSGCGGTAYCPASSTTREQMAAFVLTAREGAGYLPAACVTPVFTDVPASSPFCRFIEELVRRGVTGGCGSGNYCPAAPVSREQMAVFVLRTLDPDLDPPNCVAGSERFNDVPASSAFCRWIEELARRGIVNGCAQGLYCPTAPVTREQMAVFLTQTFGLTLYGP
jgi:hypothetical protein